MSLKLNKVPDEVLHIEREEAENKLTKLREKFAKISDEISTVHKEYQAIIEEQNRRKLESLDKTSDDYIKMMLFERQETDTVYEERNKFFHSIGVYGSGSYELDDGTRQANIMLRFENKNKPLVDKQLAAVDMLLPYMKPAPCYQNEEEVAGGICFDLFEHTCSEWYSYRLFFMPDGRIILRASRFSSATYKTFDNRDDMVQYMLANHWYDTPPDGYDDDD